MKKTSKKGFTLVEVMVTVALLSAVGVLCASLIFMAINHSRQNAQKSAFQIGVNKFIAVLNNRMNEGGDGTVEVLVESDNTLTLKVIDKDKSTTGNTVYKSNETYRYDPDEKTIFLVNGSSETIIAPYVSDVVFDYSEDNKSDVDYGKHLLKIKVKSDLDDGWLSTSFYIRQIMSDEESAA